MDDELVAGQPGRPRECELAGRGDVGADSFLPQESKERDVREGLRSVEDAAAVADGIGERPCLRPNRLLAVDDERRPEPVRELRCGNAAQRELALLHTGGVGEEREHRPILPGTVLSS